MTEPIKMPGAKMPDSPSLWKERMRALYEWYDRTLEESEYARVLGCMIAVILFSVFLGAAFNMMLETQVGILGITAFGVWQRFFALEVERTAGYAAFIAVSFLLERSLFFGEANALTMEHLGNLTLAAVLQWVVVTRTATTLILRRASAH